MEPKKDFINDYASTDDAKPKAVESLRDQLKGKPVRNNGASQEVAFQLNLLMVAVVDSNVVKKRVFPLRRAGMNERQQSAFSDRIAACSGYSVLKPNKGRKGSKA